MVKLLPTPKCVTTTQLVLAPSLGATSDKGDVLVSFADCLCEVNVASTKDSGTPSKQQTVQVAPQAAVGQSDVKTAVADLKQGALKALTLPVVANAEEKKSKEVSHKESGKHVAHKDAAAKKEAVANEAAVASPLKTQMPGATAEPVATASNAAVKGEVARQGAIVVHAGTREKDAPQAKVEDVKNAAPPVSTQPTAPDADHSASVPAGAATDSGNADRPASGRVAFSSVVSATVSAGVEASVGQTASTGKVTASVAEPRGAAVHGVERQPRTIEVGALESSSPNRLEVGLRGGTLGWLNVRAEVAADGSIHTLLRGSAGTAATLTAQLGELHRHLSDHAIEVQQITVAAVKLSATTSFDASSRGEANTGFEHGGREQRRDRAESVSTRQAAVRDDEELVSVPLVSAVNSGNVLANTGGWLSVRA